MSTETHHAEYDDPHAISPRHNGRSQIARNYESECQPGPAPYPLDHPAASIDPKVDPRAFIAAHDQDALLHALALLDFDPAALAKELRVSPFALLEWYDSDDTQSELERYGAFERHMLRLRAFKSRRHSIESLEHVLETTDNLVEKRRTATTLLRLLSRPAGESERNVERRSRDEHADLRSGPRHGTPSSRQQPGPSVAPQPGRHSEPGSGSDHKDDKRRFRQYGESTDESSGIPVPTNANNLGTPQADAPQPYVGSTQTEAPSESDLVNQDVCEQMAKLAPDREEQPPNDQRSSAAQEPRPTDVNQGGFCTEAFTGRNGNTPPKPHQRE